MFETTKRSWVIAAACLAIAGAAGCAKSGKSSEIEKRAEETSGEATRSKTVMSATIESIDVENRVVGLRDEQGKPFAVEVGPDVRIEQMKPGQQVTVIYHEAVAFSLEDPESKDAKNPETVVQEDVRRGAPLGVEFARRVKTTVKIIEVASDGTRVTFRVPEGDIRTVPVEDPNNQKKVANLRPNDAVAVTFTEKLEIAVADQPQPQAKQ